MTTDKWGVLAGVRFALASVVALNHIRGYSGQGWMNYFPDFGSFEAILGFLLISGYSIGMSYQAQPDGFLVRRIKRLYPVYIAALAFTFAATRIMSPDVNTDWLALGLNAYFLNQLLTTTSYLGPAWSLSLEFWLYCLAPLLMRLPPRQVRFLAYGSFFCYLAYTAARPVLKLPYYSGVGFGANLLLLSFLWITGLLLSRSKGRELLVMRDVGIMFTIHILAVAAIQLVYRLKRSALQAFLWNDLLGYTMQSLTLVGVYFVFRRFVVDAPIKQERSWFLRFLGDVSYPLYLLHVPVCIVLAKVGLHSGLLFYLISIVISVLVYVLLDKYSQKRHLSGAMATAS